MSTKIPNGTNLLDGRWYKITEIDPSDPDPSLKVGDVVLCAKERPGCIDPEYQDGECWFADYDGSEAYRTLVRGVELASEPRAPRHLGSARAQAREAAAVAVSRDVATRANGIRLGGSQEGSKRNMTTKTFEEAWAEKERAGYQYGEDALEQVRFGWEIAQEAIAQQRAEVEQRTGQLTSEQKAAALHKLAKFAFSDDDGHLPGAAESAAKVMVLDEQLVEARTELLALRQENEALKALLRWVGGPARNRDIWLSSGFCALEPGRGIGPTATATELARALGLLGDGKEAAK